MLTIVDAPKQAELIRNLYRAGRIRTWFRDKPEGWRLVSGLWSPLYVQLRGIGDDTQGLELLKAIGDLLAAAGSQLGVNKLVGIANAGVPLAVSASIAGDIPFVLTRKGDDAKYGEHSTIDGELRVGDSLGLVDDVATRLDTKIQALGQVRRHASELGVEVACRFVLVVVDRMQYQPKDAERAGLEVHGLVALDAKGLSWLAPEWSEKEASVIADYLKDPERYQDAGVQKELKNQGLRPR